MAKKLLPSRKTLTPNRHPQAGARPCAQSEGLIVLLDMVIFAYLPGQGPDRVGMRSGGDIIAFPGSDLRRGRCSRLLNQEDARPAHPRQFLHGADPALLQGVGKGFVEGDIGTESPRARKGLEAIDDEN